MHHIIAFRNCKEGFAKFCKLHKFGRILLWDIDSHKKLLILSGAIVTIEWANKIKQEMRDYMTEHNQENQYILQSVANALDILDLLTSHEELSVPEVSRLLGLGKSSVFRLLATLEDRHFVRKTDSAKYRLGMKLASMGNTVLNRMEIIQYAHPYLMEMTRLSGETTNLVVWDRGTKVRFVDRVLSSHAIRMDSSIGSTQDAHVVACGKVLLAYQPKEFQDAYVNSVVFKQLTPYSIMTAEALYKELERIVRVGHAADKEESELGLSCIAAPIFDSSDTVIAAISISGPIQRIGENRQKNSALVKKIAMDISAAMR